MGKKIKQKQLIQSNDNKINLLIILVLIVGFIASMGVFFLLSQDEKTYIECPIEFRPNEISDADFNKLVSLEYDGGFCERLGLESNILVQDLNGIPYGVPICVAGEE